MSVLACLQEKIRSDFGDKAAECITSLELRVLNARLEETLGASAVSVIRVLPSYLVKCSDTKLILACIREKVREKHGDDVAACIKKLDLQAMDRRLRAKVGNARADAVMSEVTLYYAECSS